MYQLGAVYMYMGKPKKAEKISEKLLDAVDETLDLLQKYQYRCAREMRPVKKWLEKMRPQIVVQRAIHLVGAGDLRGARDLLVRNEIIGKDSNPPYRVQYNLACCYSILGSKKKGKKKIRTHKKALKHLKYAFRKRGGIIQWAKIDPDLKGIRYKNNPKIHKKFEKLIKSYGPVNLDEIPEMP